MQAIDIASLTLWYLGMDEQRNYFLSWTDT